MSLPICLATGLLLFAPLGGSYMGPGIASSLYAYVIGGGIAALLARSSFVVSSPRASTALIQAGLLAGAGITTASLHEPRVILAAMAACVLLAGAWQLLFGIVRIATIIKFTPHPVLAGFINGIALLIVISQLKPFFHGGGSTSAFIERPLMLAFVIGLTAFILYFAKRMKKVPAGLVGLVLGIVLFHVAARFAPSLDLGTVVGDFSIALPPNLPVADLIDGAVLRDLEPMLGAIVLSSLALAVVATIESLLTLRTAQRLAPGSVDPARDLFAQGIANAACALSGGMAITASPLQSSSAFRAGGRSRVVAFTAVGSIALLVLLLGSAMAAIPLAVLSALLLATGVALFDRWSVGLLADALQAKASPKRHRAWGDAAVVITVMVLTSAVSIVAGIIAGCVLACMIFIVNMSRPVIRRQRSGVGLASKRVRTRAEAQILRECAGARQVLELQGVLFFGNADDLADRVRTLFAQCDSIVLDLRGVSDIDASGANILAAEVAAAHKAGKLLLFCHVPPAQGDVIDALVRGGNMVRAFADMDSALEFAEAHALERHGGGRRDPQESLGLWDHPVLDGLDAEERAAFAPYLGLRTFAAGSVLCNEGEPADRMWLLTKGSVSVRIRASPEGRALRLSSCGAGTTVGEMALLESAVRSASIIADEDVEAYELTRDAFASLSATRPPAVVGFLRNITIGLAGRLRDRSEDLRHAV